MSVDYHRVYTKLNKLRAIWVVTNISTIKAKVGDSKEYEFALTHVNGWADNAEHARNTDDYWWAVMLVSNQLYKYLGELCKK